MSGNSWMDNHLLEMVIIIRLLCFYRSDSGKASLAWIDRLASDKRISIFPTRYNPIKPFFCGNTPNVFKHKSSQRHYKLWCVCSHVPVIVNLMLPKCVCPGHLSNLPKFEEIGNSSLSYKSFTSHQNLADEWMTTGCPNKMLTPFSSYCLQQSN